MKFAAATLLVASVSAETTLVDALKDCTDKTCAEEGYVCCTSAKAATEDLYQAEEMTKCFKDGKDDADVTLAADDATKTDTATVKLSACEAATGAVATKTGFAAAALAAAYFMA